VENDHLSFRRKGEVNTAAFLHRKGRGIFSGRSKIGGSSSLGENGDVYLPMKERVLGRKSALNRKCLLGSTDRKQHPHTKRERGGRKNVQMKRIYFTPEGGNLEETGLSSTGGKERQAGIRKSPRTEATAVKERKATPPPKGGGGGGEEKKSFGQRCRGERVCRFQK